MAQTGQNNNEDSARQPAARAVVWTCLLLLCVLAAYVRVHGTENFHYNGDEVSHIDVAKGMSLGETLKFSFYEVHPALGNVLRHYWLMISDTPGFVRAESLLFGLLLIPLYYRMGVFLGGELTGLMAALLIAFGNGCIVESMTVRNYMFCVFFLSAGFYYYLLWHKCRQRSDLLAYTVFFSLAALTHVMTAFTVLCLFAGETAAQWRAGTKVQKQVPWALANLTVLAVTGAVYYLWLPILNATYYIFKIQTHHVLGLDVMLLYPVFLLQLLLPGHADFLYSILSFTTVTVLLIFLARSVAASRYYILLSLLALALGMGLLITNVYSYVNTRHALWALPFFILPVAWALSHFCRWFGQVMASAMPFFSRRSATALAALAIAALVAASYSEKERFSGPEYTMPEKEWQALTRYLKVLDSTHVILGGKASMFQLDPPGENPYRVFGTDAFTGNKQAVSVGYYNTRVVFNPFGYIFDPGSAMLRFAADAVNNNLLAGAKELVIINAAWQTPTVTDLMLCPSLQKQIITFPALPPGHAVTREELYKLPAALLIVPSDAFLRDVVAQDGNARACMTHL